MRFSSQVFSCKKYLLGISMTAICSLAISPVTAAVIYSEDFEGTGGTVPVNIAAQSGSTGTATLTIDDESGAGEIGSGDALSIVATPKGGTIGTFASTSIDNIGDAIELSFDARLDSFPSNSGGFRFGLYEIGSPWSGYRISMGTGNNAPKTTVTVDNGTGNGASTDILFGGGTGPTASRLNLTTDLINGIDDTDPHTFLLRLTRTSATTINIETFQDGVNSLSSPQIHTVDGSFPLKTSFDAFAFSTNGGTGVTAFIDNINIETVPEPSSVALLVALVLGGLVIRFKNETIERPLAVENVRS